MLCAADGGELARTTMPVHPGDLPMTVTRSIEEAFAPWLGKGWLDR
ncbi:MAG TPA: hypothetical protein VLJ59_03255 [Mycobacteriales bacterium]|nr:hypothetical protein [Mycobacteriales bacterium]